MVGLLLGLHLIKTEKASRQSCVIGADNQAALLALQSELTQPGQHIAMECVKATDRLAIEKGENRLAIEKGENRYKLTFRWTAGHIGIPGNEKADEEAKKAAQGQSSTLEELPKYLRKPLTKSISVLKQAHNAAANIKWKETWHASKRFKRFRADDIISPHSKKFLKLTSEHDISRKMASLIFQLRVGHAPLNEYLFQFKKVDSARCPACGEESETAEHYILKCPSYAHERWPLLSNIRDSTPKIQDVLSNPKTITQLINFIEATGRFDQLKAREEQR
jgi:ribonuclease HI